MAAANGTERGEASQVLMPGVDAFALLVDGPNGLVPIECRICVTLELWESRAEASLPGWRLRRVGDGVLAIRLGG